MDQCIKVNGYMEKLREKELGTCRIRLTFRGHGSIMRSRRGGAPIPRATTMMESGMRASLKAKESRCGMMAGSMRDSSMEESHAEWDQR
jgi:hypothetical protein